MSEFIVYGLKLGKSKPMVHYKTGEVIWDGVNRPIVLDRESNEKVAKMFLSSIRGTVGRTWKLWIESAK